MAVGVNGVDKAITIGKLAAQFIAVDRRVLLGAADILQAAVEKLKIWAERANVPIITQEDGCRSGGVLHGVFW
jgi:fused signal recognition particle receptor